MKKIVTSLVVLALLLGVAPWGVGRIVQSRIDRGQDTLVEAAPFVTIVGRQWKQGWFSSEQELTFEVMSPWLDSVESAAAPSKPLRISLHNVIVHGPVLWQSGLGLARMETGPVLSDATRSQLRKMFGTDEPVRIVTRIGFLGGGTTTFSGDAREIRLSDFTDSKNDGVLAWGDFRVVVGMAADLGSYRVSGKQPLLAFNSASTHTQMQLKDLTLRGNGERIVGELYEGDAILAAGQVHLAGPGTQTFDVSDFEYAVDMGREGEFLEYAMRFGSGKVESKQLSELGLQLKQVHYDLTVRRLHLATMDKLMTAIKASYSRPASSDSAADAALLQTMKEGGIALLKHDPQLVLDRIGIVTPDGEGYIKGVIKLAGITEQDFAAGFLAMVDRVDADITFEVDRKVLEKLRGGATMAEAAIDGNYIKRDGDKYVSRIQLQHGDLTVNGKPQGVPGLSPPPTAQ